MRPLTRCLLMHSHPDFLVRWPHAKNLNARVLPLLLESMDRGARAVAVHPLYLKPLDHEAEPAPTEILVNVGSARATTRSVATALSKASRDPPEGVFVVPTAFPRAGRRRPSSYASEEPAEPPPQPHAAKTDPFYSWACADGGVTASASLYEAAERAVRAAREASEALARPPPAASPGDDDDDALHRALIVLSS